MTESMGVLFLAVSGPRARIANLVEYQVFVASHQLTVFRAAEHLVHGQYRPPAEEIHPRAKGA
jgi:hypothetical protein